jgi:hypothetical protein
MSNYGRPRLEPDLQRKNHGINIRVSNNEKNFLNEITQKLAMSVSAYLIKCALDEMEVDQLSPLNVEARFWIRSLHRNMKLVSDLDYAKSLSSKIHELQIRLDEMEYYTVGISPQAEKCNYVWIYPTKQELAQISACADAEHQSRSEYIRHKSMSLRFRFPKWPIPWDAFQQLKELERLSREETAASEVECRLLTMVMKSELEPERY